MRTFRLLLYAVITVAVVVALVVVTLTLGGPDLTESQVRTVVVDTFLKEQPEAFIVTGTLTFTTSVVSESEKTLMPGILNLDLGTTIATVRAPGRAVYGFDASMLTADDIRFTGDTVSVYVPPLTVFAVEPDLEQLEQRVDVGWARMYRSSGQEQSLTALRRLQPAMRELAREYLATADYPVENTQKAVERILRPALQAAGLGDAVIVVNVRPQLIGPPVG